MTRLYLRDLTHPSGTPASEQSTALPNGTATGGPTQRGMSTSKGSNTNGFHNWSNTADTVHRDYCRYIFGWALPVAQDIDANTWTIGAAAIEGNGAVNANHCFSLYVYRSGTGVIGYIYDAHVAAGTGLFREWSGTNNGIAGTISGAAVSGVQSGDLLVLEWWGHTAPSMGTAYSQSLYYDGTTDVVDGTHNIDAASFIDTPQDLETLPSTPKSGADSASGTDEVTAKESAVTEAAAGSELLDSVRTIDDAGTATDAALLSVPQAVDDAAVGADTSVLDTGSLPTKVIVVTVGA